MIWRRFVCWLRRRHRPVHIVEHEVARIKLWTECATCGRLLSRVEYQGQYPLPR